MTDTGKTDEEGQAAAVTREGAERGHEPGSLSRTVKVLGLVSLFGVPGQIIFGHLSDRIGREWIWTISTSGFAICFLALIALEQQPSQALLT